MEEVMLHDKLAAARFVRPGYDPINVQLGNDGGTVFGVLSATGASVGEGMEAAVDGRKADENTPVRPGATVSLQPKAKNG
ncbi:MAG: hypothetical protein G01um101456_55 [Parcubacteria group bacterium Gr01-1014_56]|nr:MAG: hypothetical protein G01um101456_55 [Parcubacteria group bacterium Gr01-1014_56]